MTDTYRADRLRVLGPDGAFVAFAKDEDAAKLLVQALNGEDVTATPEPDPWPTAPLIVATFLDKRCVFGLTDVGSYDSPTGGLEAYSEHGHTQLINVVPVTVVPTAEWEALVETMRQWDEGGFAPISGKVRAIIAATDALGVDS